MFATGEDGNLELLTQAPPPKRLTPVYGHALYLPASSFTSGRACSGLNPYERPYHRAAKITQEISIGAPIFPPLTRTSSSSTSVACPDQDSTDDYPEIGGITYWNSADEGRLIIMVAPTGAPLHNSSSRHPTIGRSGVSDARTPNDGMIWNLNPDFNVVRLQTIMESIQYMTPEGSPLTALAQQGTKMANYVIAERSAGNPRREIFDDRRRLRARSSIPP
jgi:hypothetical protein